MQLPNEVELIGRLLPHVRETFRITECVEYYLAYSCGYGEEYQVWISYFPNSMTDGYRLWASTVVIPPVF